MNQDDVKEKLLKEITDLEFNYLKMLSFYEAFSESLIVVDQRGLIEMVNEKTELMFGFSREELIGMSVEILIPESLRTRHEIEKKDYLLKPKTRHMGSGLNLLARKKSGAVFPVDIGLNHVDIEGSMYVVAIITDITARKKLEQELIQSAQKLQETNQAKDKFFSIIAHDLKSPLGSFRDAIYLLTENRDSLSQPEQFELLLLMNVSARHLYDLLENLLQWSRSQTGRISFTPVDFDIYNLIYSNIELVRVNADSKNIRIEFVYENELFCHGDINMISTVVRNLLSNALKFTSKEGKITVNVQIRDEFAEISIRDTGVGIPSQNIEKLFRIDIQFTTTGTEREKGTGLGLILCKEFVEKNGGEIRVESEEGKGSEFVFTVPLSK